MKQRLSMRSPDIGVVVAMLVDRAAATTRAQSGLRNFELRDSV
jgi:hypothetical protein